MLANPRFYGQGRLGENDTETHFSVKGSPQNDDFKNFDFPETKCV